MGKKSNIFISAIILTIIAIPLFAAEKDRLAVLSFDAQNCPKEAARVVSDMVSSKIFETRIFTMIEREQIKQVFKELELQMTGCTDSSCAVRVGQLLSASKIVIGSVYKVDKYVIVVKIVNVANNKIEGNYRVEAEDESEFEAAIMDIVEKIKYDFKTDMYYSFSISLGYQAAIGDLRDLASNGFGINLNFYVNNFLYKSFILTLSSGIYLYKGNKESIDSIIGIPAMLYFGYSFNLMRNMKIIPSVGTGYYIFLMKYDPDNADVYGNYAYKREIFYDPAISVKAEIDYVFTSTIHLFLAPTYTFAFEKKNNPQMISADAGVKMFL